MKSGLSKKGAFILIYVMSMLLCIGCGSGGFKTITMDEARKILETDNDYILIDVRYNEEYVKSHIPGALSLPLEDIQAGKLDIIPDKASNIMIYCWTGRRSAEASAILVDLGYEKILNIGGMVDWKGDTEGNGAVDDEKGSEEKEE